MKATSKTPSRPLKRTLGIPANDPPTSADAPSYEELAQQVVSLGLAMAEQAKTIEKLSLEIVELRARLGMNSRNSSKPPSSTGMRSPRQNHGVFVRARNPASNQATPDTIWPSVLILMRRRSTDR
jgi:hypothetical protein